MIVLQALLTAIVCQAISFFLFSVPLWLPPPERFTLQYEPLTHAPFSPELLGEPQTRHRILGPLLAYLLGLHGLASAAIPILAGTIMLSFVYLFTWFRLERAWSFWTTLLLATTQTVMTSQTWIGYQDALAGACVAACLLTRRMWLVAVLLFVGMLADERCIVGMPFVVAIHCWPCTNPPWRMVMPWLSTIIVAACCWAVYFAYALQHFVPQEVWLSSDPVKYDPIKIATTFHYLFKNVNHLALGYFESLRGGWLIVGFGVWHLYVHRKWKLLIMIVVLLMAGLLQAGMVADISRAAATEWPAILFGLHVLKHLTSDHSFFLLKASCMLNVFTPCYQVLGTVVQYYYPLPVSMIRLLYRI